jgi:hypothetical protein
MREHAECTWCVYCYNSVLDRQHCPNEEGACDRNHESRALSSLSLLPPPGDPYTLLRARARESGVQMAWWLGEEPPWMCRHRQ